MIAVHFGAGNIGRGFIGQQLSQAGYEVCFVDVDQELVDEINRRKEYTVILANEDQESSKVKRVRALHGKDMESVSDLIAGATLITTAVGASVLPLIAPVIAQGISKRIKSNQSPLNIIACENMIGGSTQLKELVYERLDHQEKEQTEQVIGFPDAAVDRIVPLQKHEDRLLVTVEPYFEWVVDQSKLVGEMPQVKAITYVNDLAPYIERKLYTVNTGHAILAYLGYWLGYETIEQAINDPYIIKVTDQALKENGSLLIAKYGLDVQKHYKYIQNILKRFSNPFISDQVTRVGRSPIRKLSPNDRLVGPALQAINQGITPTYLAVGIAAAFLFHSSNDPEAIEVQENRTKWGLDWVVQHYTQITSEHSLYQMIIDQTHHLESLKEKKH